MNDTTPNRESGAPNIRFPEQLEYAKSWFEYHATQRISMFNYFLVVAGFLVSAYSALVQKDLLFPSAAVCVLGIFISVFAALIDVRNAELVKLAEEVLKNIEREFLFPVENGAPQVGIILMDQFLYAKRTGISKFIKYSWLLRGTHALIGFGFVVLGVASLLTATQQTVTSGASSSPSQSSSSHPMKAVIPSILQPTSVPTSKIVPTSTKKTLSGKSTP